jgi:hypothetical protein
LKTRLGEHLGVPVVEKVGRLEVEGRKVNEIVDFLKKLGF